MLSAAKNREGRISEGAKCCEPECKLGLAVSFEASPNDNAARASG